MPRNAPSPYAATVEKNPEGALVDVRLTVSEKTWHLAGRGGAAAEAGRALELTGLGGLPVFLGAGLGAGIRAVRERYAGQIFVLDRETAIEAVTGVRAALATDSDIRFLSDPDPERAAAVVADAARLAGFSRLAIVTHPLYPRLDPTWYGAVAERLARYAALRERLVTPRFAGRIPRVLLLWRPYFLYREIEAALTRLGVPFRRVETGTKEQGETDAVAAILSAAAEFQPDFALTVNHLGLDREGLLAGLLADISLPLASWFVDSPRLILHDYNKAASPLAMVFSYDADGLGEVRALGFSHADWLPLATDPQHFALPPSRPAAPPAGRDWQARTSFVGASMVSQAGEALARLAPYPGLARALPLAAAGFVRSPEKSARRFLEGDAACGPAYAALPTGEARLDAELALTWEATRVYRHACVRGLLGFSPLVVGDPAWETVLPGAGRDWRRLPELHYYDALPDFYPQSAVNLNCTSLQMKGAVNQRVFDVPACGGFVLTDAREQLGALFSIGGEAAVYADPAEIPDMVRHYLAHPAERRRISRAARARILAEHTYEHRLRTLLGAMKKAFGG
ncbi:MAG: glycosyltransferase [Solidesulfovibrio sp.]